MGCQAESKYGSTWFYPNHIHDYKMFSNYKRGDENLQSNYDWDVLTALANAHANGRYLDACYNDTGIDCSKNCGTYNCIDDSVLEDTSIECCQYAGYLTKGIDLLISFGSSTLA